MKVKREIVIYQKIGEELIEIIEINIPIGVLSSIFNIDKKEDPNVYKIYQITTSEFLKLKPLIPELQTIDFDKFDMYYECSQV